MAGKIIIVSPEVFNSKELSQYEYRILSNKNITEREASAFFTEFPKFLTIGGYLQIAKEIAFYNSSRKRIYRVDFCRRKYGEDFWDFVELKSPKVPFIVKRGKHWKFSAAIEQGISQAADYSDFLENDLNRLEIEKRTGLRIFRPKVLIIGGRIDNEIDPIELRR